MWSLTAGVLVHTLREHDDDIEVRTVPLEPVRRRDITQYSHKSYLCLQLFFFMCHMARVQHIAVLVTCGLCSLLFTCGFSVPFEHIRFLCVLCCSQVVCLCSILVICVLYVSCFVYMSVSCIVPCCCIVHTWIVGVQCLVAFGRHVMSGSWDNTLVLWGVDEGKMLLKLRGHTEGNILGTISAYKMRTCGLMNSLDLVVIMQVMVPLFSLSLLVVLHLLVADDNDDDDDVTSSILLHNTQVILKEVQ